MPLGKELVQEFINSLSEVDELELKKLGKVISPFIEVKEPNRRLNLGESAKYCGVSRSTFTRWQNKYRELQDIRIIKGGSVRFNSYDLDEFMKNKDKKRRRYYSAIFN